MFTPVEPSPPPPHPPLSNHPPPPLPPPSPSPLPNHPPHPLHLLLLLLLSLITILLLFKGTRFAPLQIKTRRHFHHAHFLRPRWQRWCRSSWSQLRPPAAGILEAKRRRRKLWRRPRDGATSRSGALLVRPFEVATRLSLLPHVHDAPTSSSSPRLQGFRASFF